MFTVTLSSKGQIVLPQQVRRALGLQEGDKLEVVLKNQIVWLIPLPSERGAG
ncbi:MAG: AbrB/MazE/SpoVT family DNA-binding domain-containing protein [Anaerolineae bacterium]|nr:AbrB/MazE/SpoVT family DNA-binding domain-containing protein [Anaerolineae bacterium]